MHFGEVQIIPSPIWSTTWTYALYGAGLLLVALFVYLYCRSQWRLRTLLAHEQFEAERLKALDRLKSKFYVRLSHEFRTPLTLMMAPIEQLLQKLSDGPSRKQLQAAKSSGDMLIRLTNQLLDLAKLQSGKMTLQVAEGELISFLRGVFFSFELLASEKDLRLEFRSEIDVCKLYTDYGKLEHVFYNLVGNAIKYTRTGGKVLLTCKIDEQNHRVRVRLRDTGIGIPEEQLPHIFDPFYQVANDGVSHEGRSGIGLALVKEIVECLHGDIQVRSVQGEGTEFEVLLPMDPNVFQAGEFIDEDSREAAKVDTEPDHASDAFPAESGLILIVEDHPDVRALIQQSLAVNYETIEADNGQLGFEMALSRIPDVIVSDVLMPIMDGFELCEKLRGDDRTNHIPIILLTARATAENRLAGLAHGADEYLVKPFSVTELQTRVRNILEQRSRLQVKFQRETLLRPADVDIPSADKQFIENIRDIIERHMGDEAFSVMRLAEEIGLSRSQLHRKCRAVIGQPASDLILQMRLDRAELLIRENAATISEIAYMCGFNTPNYFAQCFRKRFGSSPSEYRRQRNPHKKTGK